MLISFNYTHTGLAFTWSEAYKAFLASTSALLTDTHSLKASTNVLQKSSSLFLRQLSLMTLMGRQAQHTPAHLWPVVGFLSAGANPLTIICPYCSILLIYYSVTGKGVLGFWGFGVLGF